MNFVLIMCPLLHQLLYKYDLILLALGDSYETLLSVRKLRLREVKVKPVSGTARL